LGHAHYRPGRLGGTGYLFARHTGVGNYLFAAGRVKALRPAATVNECDAATAGCTPKTTNLWRNDNMPFTDTDFTRAKAMVNATAQRCR
jgi:hypothetical protein